MFKRLHYQLTGLCALITISILTVFAVLYLTVSEHTLRDNFELSFRHNFDSLCGSLEQQSLLTHPFLLRMEQNNDCVIFLWDNGQALSFNKMASHAAYADTALSLYEEYRAATDSGELARGSARILNYGDLNAGIGSIHTGRMNAVEQSLALQRREGTVIVMLSSATALRDRILRQRVLFLLLSLAGCVALTAFAWVFTGRMLGPIQANQQSQLDFISGASHELRTPLAVILSSVEARPPGYEETIRFETLRMGRLVEELLTLTRLYNQDPHASAAPDTALFRPERLAPDTLLLTFYEQTLSHVRACGKQLRLRLPDEDVPAIYADRDKLFQLFEILVQNALTYTGADGVITLSLTADTAPDMICFAIADNGRGIPDREKDKIFERFYRGDNARNSGEHFGLGLSIAAQIIGLHRGTIRVMDTSPRGSTFLCLIPRA